MDYKELANIARIKVLTMVHKAGTSHIASNFSVIDIATVLYENLKEGDEVVWSKGWAAATIYYFLAKQGKIPWEDLDKFPNPPYLALAETNLPGVHVSGGSMGHGLPVAVGMALAKKRANEPGTIYCIMSDGEMNEGTTWESAMLAAHHKLDNLVVFVDANKWQAMGRTEEIIDVSPISNKFATFGWAHFNVNGHDYNDMHKNFKRISTLFRYRPGYPSIVVCDTIKGKSVSFFEDHLLYHYKNVDAEDYQKAMKELGVKGEDIENLKVDPVAGASQYYPT